MSVTTETQSNILVDDTPVTVIARGAYYAGEDRVNFPPFPKAPDGVIVIPFRDFQEGGIRVEPGPDGVEVCSKGIPTVAMEHVHKDDVCKTNTKRKRQEEERKFKAKAGIRREWYEVWEDTEVGKRSTSFDPRSSGFEKMHAATTDFTRLHNWPQQIKKDAGPRRVWQRFLQLIGVPEGYTPLDEQINTKATKKAKEAAEAEEDMYDDEEDEDAFEAALEGGTTSGIREVEELPAHVNLMGKISNEDRLGAFLHDPVHAISVFMSSYAYAKGLVWTEENLPAIARLMQFFVQFLLRSNVFTDAIFVKQLQRAQKVIEVALVELPALAVVMRTVPEPFAEGCRACWGNRGPGYEMVDVSEIWGEPEAASDEPEAKKQKVDDPPSNDWGASSNGWGSSTGGWGNTAGQGWGNTADGDPVGVATWATSEGIILEPDTVDKLVAEEELKQPHLNILGLTALPLTHSTGVVERSMRVIKDILPPNPNPPKSPAAPGGPDGTAIEVELDRYLSKVILSPLIDWDGGEAPVYSRPSIMKTSKGPVIEEGKPAPTDLPEGSPKPHDPLNDDIIVLMDPALVSTRKKSTTEDGEEEVIVHLQKGMGIGGTFVQLARQAPPIKKKKGKSKKNPPYWYLEAVAFIKPSFWAV